MRRTLQSLAVVITALLLTACLATPGTATVTFGDPANPTRVTSVSGLESRDAAYTTSQGAYYDAKVRKPDRKACEIEAKEGQTITGLAKITCYSSAAADDDDIAPAQRAPTAFSENVRAVGDAGAKLLGAATPMVGIKEGAETIRSTNANAAKDPLVVEQPAPVIVRPEVVLVP